MTTMDWKAVIEHLRMTSRFAYEEATRIDTQTSGYHEVATQKRLVGELCASLAAALHAGMAHELYAQAAQAQSDAYRQLTRADDSSR